jgi:hypothetical protein
MGKTPNEDGLVFLCEQQICGCILKYLVALGEQESPDLDAYFA